MKDTQTQWWQADPDDVHESLHDTLNAIRGQQSGRIDDLRFLRMLYGARPKVFGAEYVTMAEGNAPPLPINVIAEVVDSYVATVVRAKTRVVEVSVGGSYEQRQKAQDRTKFHDGVAYETKLRRDSRRIGREAAVVGAGMLKGYHENGRLHHWVVPIERIWVDELDAEDGTPRCIYHRHYIDRYQLAALHPKKRALILDSKSGIRDDDRWDGYAPQADQVLVTEGWHLRSGPDEDDGRHVVAIDNTALIDTEWTWDRFPFAKCEFEPPMSGYWPQSIVEKIEGPQASISDILEQMLANLRQFGKPRIFVERGSRVNPTDFTDGLDAEIIEYTGKEPNIATVVAVPADIYRAIEMCRESAYQRVGMPELSSSGGVPPGVESMPGIRAISDMKLARHALAGEAWEEWRLDVADLDLNVARELAKEKKFSTIFVGRRYGRTEAKRVAYWDPADGEEYVLRSFPAGQMSDSLSGRLDQTERMEARGFISKEESMDLVEVPDIDQAIDSRTAGLKAIEDQLNTILTKSEPQTPEPYLPLQLALVKGRDAYNLAKIDGIDDERLDLLRGWIDQVQAMMQPEPSQVPVPPPGPDPMAAAATEPAPPPMPVPPEGTVMQ